MSKKYLDVKKGSLEESVIDIWQTAAEEETTAEGEIPAEGTAEGAESTITTEEGKDKSAKPSDDKNRDKSAKSTDDKAKITIRRSFMTHLL